MCKPKVKRHSYIFIPKMWIISRIKYPFQNTRIQSSCVVCVHFVVVVESKIRIVFVYFICILNQQKRYTQNSSDNLYNICTEWLWKSTGLNKNRNKSEKERKLKALLHKRFTSTSGMGRHGHVPHKHKQTTYTHLMNEMF